MTQDATRRGVLAAVLALPLLAAGCKGIGALGTPPRPRPDVAVVRSALAGEELLISRYTAVLAIVPGLEGTLRPILRQHSEHLGRLRERLIDPRAGGEPGKRPSAAPAPAQVPGSVTAARDYLRLAEHAASEALLAGLATASPALAQLLASIAASEATHAMLLGSHWRAG